MSQVEKIKAVTSLIRIAEHDFNKLAKVHGAVHYDRESSFALQAMKNNSYLCGVAYNDQDSLKMAVINVAAIGLTLNPIRRLAYLIPRDKKIVLDISYLGFIQLAVDIGSIKWAKAEIVYEGDDFSYNGLGIEPTHKFNPFSKDRGEIVGAYCCAKTFGDDYLTEMMPIDEIYSIRGRSVSYKAYLKDNGKNTPWNSDPTEMIKKTVIKRAYKSWPMTDTSARARMDNAIDINQEETAIDVGPVVDVDSPERINRIEIVKGKLEFLERSEEDSIGFLERICQRKIEGLSDLTNNELERFEAMLDGFIENMEEEKTEKEKENEDTKGSESTVGDVREEDGLSSTGGSTGE